MTNGRPDCQANGATLLPSRHSSSHRGGLGCQIQPDSKDSNKDRMRIERTMRSRRRLQDREKDGADTWRTNSSEGKREQIVSKVKRETLRTGDRKGTINVKEKKSQIAFITSCSWLKRPYNPGRELKEKEVLKPTLYSNCIVNIITSKTFS